MSLIFRQVQEQVQIAHFLRKGWLAQSNQTKLYAARVSDTQQQAFVC
jgi:hypothetical protein